MFITSRGRPPLSNPRYLNHLNIFFRPRTCRVFLARKRASGGRWGFRTDGEEGTRKEEGKKKIEIIWRFLDLLREVQCGGGGGVVKNVPESIWTSGSLQTAALPFRATRLCSPRNGLSLPRYNAVSCRGHVADVASPYRAGSRPDIRYPASSREDDKAHTLDGQDTARYARYALVAVVTRDGSRESRGTK